MSSAEYDDSSDRNHCMEYSPDGHSSPGEEAFFLFSGTVLPEASIRRKGPLFGPSKVIRIRIGLIPSKTLSLQKRLDHQLGRDESPSTPCDDKHHYWAEAIKDGDKFYYRVNGITVEISEDELRKVINNPYLYYFTTALKLHKRIEGQRWGVPPRVDATVVQLVNSEGAFLNINMIKEGQTNESP